MKTGVIYPVLNQKGQRIGFQARGGDGSVRGGLIGVSGLHTFRSPDPEPERHLGLTLFASSRGTRRRQRAEAKAEKQRLATRGY